MRSLGVLYAGLASAIIFVVSAAPARAGNVFSDYATGLAHVTGTATGETVVSTPSPTVMLVNGLAPPGALTLGIAENIHSFTGPVGDVDTITSGTGTEVITDSGGDRIRLQIRITSGVAEFGEVRVTGVITAASGSADVGGFNFYSLVGGSTTLVDSQAIDFTAVFGRVGVTAQGGALSVTATADPVTVPEPTSISLCGVGIAVLLVARRYLIRRSAAGFRRG